MKLGLFWYETVEEYLPLTPHILCTADNFFCELAAVFMCNLFEYFSISSSDTAVLYFIWEPNTMTLC